MIYVNGITYNNYRPNFKQNNTQGNKVQSSAKIFMPAQNKKITFNEGAKLFGIGIMKQAGDMLTTIIENPIKTLATLGIISGAIMVLPFVGIPTAVGAGALAVSFAGIAVAKGISHALTFAKYNKEGTYDFARISLMETGGDIFDLALSAPFIPKGLKDIKNFAKYGKVGFNKDLINSLKTSGNKFKILRQQDSELYRDINFQNAVDKEIAFLEGVSKEQKANIKQELLDFNISEDKLPELVLDKWAKYTGIKTKPELKYQSYPEDALGYAYADDCSIRLNDYKQKFNNNTFSRYEEISRETKGDTVYASYRDTKTGEIISESISQKILEQYLDQIERFSKLSPQARKILTTIHEREHIFQFAKKFAINPDWLKTITTNAREIYSNMVKEMKPLTLEEQAETILWFRDSGPNTLFSYIKKPSEIGARWAENQAFQRPLFKILDRIYNRLNKSTTITPYIDDVLINDVRLESAKN